MSAAPREPTAPRTALVTGASSGIGAAVARALGALGWSVAVGARRSEELARVARELEAAGGKAFAHPLDVAEPASIEAFFDAAEAALGPVDAVVSNAGLCVPGPLHEAAVADLQLEIATNLVGPLVLARRAVRGLLQRGAPGDLVFVSSENAVRPRPSQVAYTASKAGIEGLARALRMELEGTGIRSTIVRPGPTGTGFGRTWSPEKVRSLLSLWKYWGVQRHLAWMPPESVARAVVTALTAPPGTHVDEIQVMPEGPPRTGGAEGDETR